MRNTIRDFNQFIRRARLSLALGSLVAWTAVILLHSCTKSTSPSNAVSDSLYLGGLPFVLKDNSTFSTFYGTLQSSGYLDSITGSGPFTVLAPNNDGYSGFTPSAGGNTTHLTTNFIEAIGGSTILPLYISNDLIRGRNSFRSLPLQTNQALTTFTGSRVYVTRYLSGSDTITTVNGQPVISIDNPATNGLIQVVQGICNPQRYPTVLQQLESDTSYAYFTAALKRSHLDTVLAGAGPFTVLAPGNDAFRSLNDEGLNPGINITSIDSILVADPVRLASIIGLHILPGRYFINDFWRLLKADSLTLTAYTGENVQFLPNPYTPSSFPYRLPGPGFTARGNSQATVVYRKIAGILSAGFCLIPNCYTVDYMDWPAGNGVVDGINTLLVP